MVLRACAPHLLAPALNRLNTRTYDDLYHIYILMTVQLLAIAKLHIHDYGEANTQGGGGGGEGEERVAVYKGEGGV